MQRPIIKSNYQPVAAPPPHRFPEELPDEPKKQGSKLWMLYGALAVLGIAGLYTLAPLYFKSKSDSYKVEYLAPVEITHEVVGEKKNLPLPKVDSAVSRTDKDELYNGKGMEIKLISTYDGAPDDPDVTTIDPEKSFEEIPPAQRQKYVDDKLAEVKAKIDKLGVYTPKDWNFVFVFDNTEPMSKDLQAKFEKVYNDMLLDERVKLGDSVTVNFSKLTSTDLKQDRKVVIPKGTGKIADGIANELKAGKEFLLQSANTGSSTSSVFRGLLNILSGYAKQGHTRVVILSDMMENDRDPSKGTGVTFYGKSPDVALLADQAKWKDLDAKLLKGIEKPDLTGLTIKIYAPPSVIKNPVVARNAQNYSKHLLSDMSATVNVEW